MVRLLLEDVTLLADPEVITAQVRFKGGATETVTVAVSRGRRTLRNCWRSSINCWRTTRILGWLSNSTSADGAPIKENLSMPGESCLYDAITS